MSMMDLEGICWVQMATKVNIHRAKTDFSRLVSRAMAGERIIIARAGRPIAELAWLDQKRKRRVPGPDQGLVLIGPDFDDPLSEFEEHA
jgi:antitoxin (DNA-binding transcriptional repressor) of toxin-antitoxin stability system